jgi:hypothetical protein
MSTFRLLNRSAVMIALSIRHHHFGFRSIGQIIRYESTIANNSSSSSSAPVLSRLDDIQKMVYDSELYSIGLLFRNCKMLVLCSIISVQMVMILSNYALVSFNYCIYRFDCRFQFERFNAVMASIDRVAHLVKYLHVHIYSIQAHIGSNAKHNRSNIVSIFSR